MELNVALDGEWSGEDWDNDDGSISCDIFLRTSTTFFLFAESIFPMELALGFDVDKTFPVSPATSSLVLFAVPEGRGSVVAAEGCDRAGLPFSARSSSSVLILKSRGVAGGGGVVCLALRVA